MDNCSPGKCSAPYRIINQIGQGGMATVYKAYQPPWTAMWRSSAAESTGLKAQSL
jgi:hypothetical protein